MKEEAPLEVHAKKVLCLEFVVCISNGVKGEGQSIEARRRRSAAARMEFEALRARERGTPAT